MFPRSHAFSVSEQPISHRLLAVLTYIGISARLFFLCVIDLNETANALWLAPFLGALLALPCIGACRLALGASDMPLKAFIERHLGKYPSAAVFGALAVIFIYEASAVFEALTESAAYATLFIVPESAILLITVLSCTVIAARGGNSSGGIAAVWLWCAPILYILAMLSQMTSIRFYLLTPLFGTGFQNILRASLRCAFYYALIPVGLFFDDGRLPVGHHEARRARPACVLWLWAACALTVCVMCVLHATLFPYIPNLPANRSFRLDLFLSTGKNGRSVQLPMLVMWFGSLAVSAVYMLYTAGRLLGAVFGKERALFPFSAGAAAFLFDAFSLAKQKFVLSTAQWLGVIFPIFGSVGLLLLLKRGKDGRGA